jgi:DtxR family Mn-dependent transcriptional regulator
MISNARSFNVIAAGSWGDHNASPTPCRQRTTATPADPLTRLIRATTVPSLTVENYVKTIEQITSAQGGRPATTGQLAAALDVSPGTVTSMLKTLDAARLATHRPYEGVALTRAGRGLALRVIRRHRLIELFLLKTLDMTWDEVHDEAEHMEHAVSDLLVERIDAFLGRPDVDTHGDPIPRADAVSLASDDEPVQPLAACAAGTSFRLARVLDQSPDFLRYLTECGLTLGTRGAVESNPDGAGLMRIRIGDRGLALAIDAAGKLVVAAG